MRDMKTPSSQPGAEIGFTWPIRVYYEDTDAAGIVFYANYLKFFERARTEWLRACGIEQGRLVRETGTLFIISSTALDYRAPARLDDQLTIVSRIEKLGRATVDFAQEAWRDGTLLVTGTIRVGCVNAATLRPIAIAPAVTAALRRGPSDCGPSNDSGNTGTDMSTADA
ncbi:tol-pal system-associated acyl-CoA thioesterase [Paraburkholderia rhizosphaerae]|uniref:(3S)-malyl-CoA thioesterase n=1 Tax=Paraburkholderia rhizosphaerae TaxID=480658 RepID=A0A4R8LBW6_9BURK|nr:tol-pal system-associated acyl-CoA thioesterase [Paraburkholderia rhizosphaerae]TDY40367.1 (3S)-malyl-CoA thioesterase [Paraburkholderia rhizosphaerae]